VAGPILWCAGVAMAASSTGGGRGNNSELRGRSVPTAQRPRLARPGLQRLWPIRANLR